MKYAAPFLVLLVFWIALAWPSPATPAAAWPQAMVAGALAALGVTAVMHDRAAPNTWRWADPRRWGWAAVALATLAFYVVKANLDVAYRVLHPALPIHPGIVKIHTRLTTPAARTALANAITLTPGTLSVAVTDHGDLYVHWIDVKSHHPAEATRLVAGRFEPLIGRVFE